MKKLYKSRKCRVIAGVCGGIAEYLDVDPVLIRLIAVLFFFTGGATLIAYIIGMIIIPERPTQEIGEGALAQEQNAAAIGCAQTDRGHAGSLIIGVLLIVFGIHFLLRNIPFFQPYYWWFWDMSWQFFWPSVLILVGLLVILRGSRR